MKVVQNLMFVGVKRFDFKADDGKTIRMSKVYTLDPLKPMKKDNQHGYMVADVSADYSLFDKLYKLQALKLYDFEIEIEIDGKKTNVFIANVLDK